MFAPGQRGERQMSRADVPAVERIIANTINETARGDPDALAARIVAALGEAGYSIIPAIGMEDTARGPQPHKELMRNNRVRAVLVVLERWCSSSRLGRHCAEC